MPAPREFLLGIELLALVLGGPALGADAGICARCHEQEAALAQFDGGHAAVLDCTTCHEERRPGVFGHRHRKVPTSCTSHHAGVETHPARTADLRPGRLRRSCLKGHDVHGSTNAHLVRTAIRARGRLRPVEFVTGDSFVDPERPGRGLCEVCHQSTRFYPASGHGEAHFTGECTLCHDHAAGFHEVVSDASCDSCHAEEALRLAKPNLHHDRFTGKCSSCHAEVAPEPGPGHRATSPCADCHSAALVATHVPPGEALDCVACHEPHGSDNIRLIRDVVRAPDGTEHALRFDDLTGQSDGSFASASAPGTGLCEVCHTRTAFYRVDGGGAPHYTADCLTCHPHAAGFLPR
jgi:predicted CXXCH cytochrome family protein